MPIVRDVIVQKEVITKDLANGAVGYIHVTGFSDNSASQFHDALKADLDAGKKKIILDLRGNPGGYVTAARRIAVGVHRLRADLLGGGRRGRPGRDRRIVRRPGDVRQIQLVVLVDKGSASASEIVAGALQDRHRAQLVGETSFGKGTVQQWIELQDNGALKLTIAKWLTPDKRWIHHVGLTPDVTVATPAQPDPNEDPQLDKAVETLTAGRLTRR